MPKAEVRGHPIGQGQLNEGGAGQFEQGAEAVTDAVQGSPLQQAGDASHDQGGGDQWVAEEDYDEHADGQEFDAQDEAAYQRCDAQGGNGQDDAGGCWRSRTVWSLRRKW